MRSGKEFTNIRTKQTNCLTEWTGASERGDFGQYGPRSLFQPTKYFLYFHATIKYNLLTTHSNCTNVSCTPYCAEWHVIVCDLHTLSSITGWIPAEFLFSAVWCLITVTTPRDSLKLRCKCDDVQHLPHITRCSRVINPEGFSLP